MSCIYFITGSQDLYGDETLKQVNEDSRTMAVFLNEKLRDTVNILYQPAVLNSEGVIEVMEKANLDRDCIGIITWMHTFSPAKMWIKGLQILHKPLLHLHTQFNQTLPYDTIDMDFMNLNQSAHGDREFGFILARLNIPHEICVGYYRDEIVLSEIARFARVSSAISFSKNLKVAMFGGNMREVAVTDGDRVESQIRYGWEVNYFDIGGLVEYVNDINNAEIEEKISEYCALYTINTNDLSSLAEQAKYEIALDRFLTKGSFGAFTDSFQTLSGLKQLPGLAVQRMMARGIGFGAEGDYKTAALNAILWKLAEGLPGSTGFMEDYTYDFEDELVLGSHMLEVNPSFASTKPVIEVHPLGIGGKEPPARLVFDGVKGDGLSVCMIDMGTHFRLIAANIELVSQPKPMPNLPVARVMWRLKPDFESGAKAWLAAGGGHHTVISTALIMDDVKLFAKLTGTEIVTIG